jgi:hypothetical protein
LAGFASRPIIRGPIFDRGLVIRPMCIRHQFSLCLAAIALFAIGCAGTQMPNWYHPGPAGYQRYNALQFDP